MQREHSRDRQPPPKLQQATSAILGHSTSHQSLHKLAVSGSEEGGGNNVITSRSNSETAMHSQSASNTSQPHVAPQPTTTATALPDTTTFDLADPWGRAYLHSSPYDLGQAPLAELRIPVFQPGAPGTVSRIPSIIAVAPILLMIPI